MSKKRFINKALGISGDGSGVINLNGDYSVTPLWAHWKNETGHDCKITRTIMKIQDAGAMDAEKYGNGITLTKGLRFYKRDKDNNVIQELTAYPLLSSGDLSGHCHDVTRHAFGTGDEVLSVRWSFDKSGEAIFLDPGESIGVLLNDSFVGLTDHKFIIQGDELIP